MPFKTVKYKANSIIYFNGDKSDRIFILKKGSVSLEFENPQNGKKETEYIKNGEFFGVKSCLGGYLHDDTAFVQIDSEVVVLTLEDFQALIKNNSRLTIKMLKVFSNQLRRIHHQLQDLLSKTKKKDEPKPDEGLFNIGYYYLKNKEFAKALYALKQYSIYYPKGARYEEVLKLIEAAEKGTVPAKRPEVTDVDINMGYSLYEEENYLKAAKIFEKVIANGAEPEILGKAKFHLASCHFHSGKQAQAMEHLTAYLQEYPKGKEKGEALYYLGMLTARTEDKDKAKEILSQALGLSQNQKQLAKKIEAGLASIAEG